MDAIDRYNRQLFRALLYTKGDANEANAMGMIYPTGEPIQATGRFSAVGDGTEDEDRERRATVLVVVKDGTFLGIMSCCWLRAIAASL